MPKRAKEGGGGGGNKKKKQVGLAGYGKTFIKAGKWDKYKGTYVLMSDAIYGKKVPENARGKSFLYSVYEVSDGDDDDPRFVLKWEKKAVEAGSGVHCIR